jgi:hypothetical protein
MTSPTDEKIPASVCGQILGLLVPAAIINSTMRTFPALVPAGPLRLTFAAEPAAVGRERHLGGLFRVGLDR